jgi:excisionase family DNA binding protein
MHAEEKFFTREEARRLLRFSTSKLDAETRSGHLKIHSFGRLVRIDAGDLDEYIRQGRNDAAAESSP